MDKVMHFHIPVDDMARAKKFYKNIFGWEMKETGMGMDFQLVATTPTDEEGMPLEPGGINGGLYKRERPEQTQSVVINVPSIDDYLKKIEKAGGKVIQQKMPVEDFGFYAMIADTEGNFIGLWEDVG